MKPRPKARIFNSTSSGKAIIIQFPTKNQKEIVKMLKLAGFSVQEDGYSG